MGAATSSAHKKAGGHDSSGTTHSSTDAGLDNTRHNQCGEESSRALRSVQIP